MIYEEFKYIKIRYKDENGNERAATTTDNVTFNTAFKEIYFDFRTIKYTDFISIKIVEKDLDDLMEEGKIKFVQGGGID